ncbi:MAG: hypothetical protein ABIS84_02255 [Arachnia sp.]
MGVLRHADSRAASGRVLVELVGSLPPVTTSLALPQPAALSSATPRTAAILARFMMA